MRFFWGNTNIKSKIIGLAIQIRVIFYSPKVDN